MVHIIFSWLFILLTKIVKHRLIYLLLHLKVQGKMYFVSVFQKGQFPYLLQIKKAAWQTYLSILEVINDTKLSWPCYMLICTFPVC